MLAVDFQLTVIISPVVDNQGISFHSHLHCECVCISFTPFNCFIHSFIHLLAVCLADAFLNSLLLFFVCFCFWFSPFLSLITNHISSGSKLQWVLLDFKFDFQKKKEKKMFFILHFASVNHFSMNKTKTLSAPLTL